MSAASRKVMPWMVTSFTGAAFVPLIEISVSSCTATYSVLAGGAPEEASVAFGMR